MAESIGAATARVVSMAEAAGRKRSAAPPKAKPAPPRYIENGHFSRCPAAAVFDQTITDGELRALAAAGAFTEKGTMICRASQITIARHLGVHRQSVSRWFTALVAKGYMVLVNTTRRAHGGRGPNVYRLIYPAMNQDEVAGTLESQSGAGGDHPSRKVENCV